MRLPYKTVQQSRGLLARRAIARFGHMSIDLALDRIQLPSGSLAYPNLKSVSPDGEVLYWECETGKVQLTSGTLANAVGASQHVRITLQ